MEGRDTGFLTIVWAGAEEWAGCGLQRTVRRYHYPAFKDQAQITLVGKILRGACNSLQ